MNHTPTTILVVDDDPGVQRLAAQILRTEGYNVLVASDTPDAMHVSDEYSAGIDLLLTDIMLPTGNGISLAIALLAKRPDAQVLYMSGFTADAIQAVQHEAGPNGGFLEKPFLPRTLVDRVRMVVPPNEREVPILVQPEPVLGPTAVLADVAPGANSDAVYRLESPARCPQCGETISTLRAVRLLRTQVNFRSTLPRRGRIITCPCCFSIVPAELTNF